MWLHSAATVCIACYVDYCVIATGQIVPFPANTPQPARTERIAAFTQLQRNVAASKSIVIVGGGLTGCELAGEIAAQYVISADGSPPLFC